MRRFNTVEGVFIPCLLSILGVIMYLRLGWVIGQVGLISALAIILISNVITLATALSMSSVVTNIRIGTGGAHSIIAKSLGIEAGGAIGIPLFLAQALSVGFYITGFTECWAWVFPQHSLLLVALIVWLAIAVVSYVSTKLAFQLQYVIVSIIVLSLVSIALGHGQVEAAPIWRGVPGGDFWKAFSIFFPAVTGILAGAAMSGELKTPRESIPVGTLAAIGVSLLIYVVLAVWLSFHASAEDLVSNTTILIDRGRWRWLVVGGIMGATLSSALAMFVGAPRTLVALGKHAILPFSEDFTRLNKRSEPTTAILFTSLLVLLTLLFGTLDSVAGLLTMVFLITYGMINFIVLVEQTIGITSFRPTFRIPALVPFLGGVGCVVCMFVIDIRFSLIASTLIVAIYIVLLRKGIKVHSPDVRSGLLIFLAEQMMKTALRLPYHPKIWKPNMLMVAPRTEDIDSCLSLIKAIIWPKGRGMFFLIREFSKGRAVTVDEKDKQRERLNALMGPLRETGILLETSVITTTSFPLAADHVVQTVRDMVLPPNMFFYVLPDDPGGDQHSAQLIQQAAREGLGVIVLNLDARVGLCREKMINLWIRRQSPNVDLSILTSLQLYDNWEGQVRIVQAVDCKGDVEEAQHYLERLKKLLRLPEEFMTDVLVGGFQEVILNAPAADVNIFGMPETVDISLIRNVAENIQTSVLFLRDSKHESAVV